MNSMFFAEELLVNHSVSEGCEKDLKTPEETSCSPISLSQKSTSRKFSSGKTSQVSCHLTEDGILEPSSGAWQNAGMGSPTEFSTLSISESPSNGVVLSLLHVLETQSERNKYYLSRKALLGVLRRNERRLCRFVSQPEARALSMTEKRMLLMGMEYDT